MFQNHTRNRDIIPKDVQDIPVEKTDGRIIEIECGGLQSLILFGKQKSPNILTGEIFRIFTLIF